MVNGQADRFQQSSTLSLFQNIYTSSPVQSRALTITNAGSVPCVVVSITNDPTAAAWLDTSLVRAGFAIPGFGASVSGQVYANPDNLAVGVYNASLRFTFLDNDPPVHFHAASISIIAGYTIDFKSTDFFGNGSRVLTLFEGDVVQTDWALRSKPNANVIITLASPVDSESGFNVSTSSLTFTPANWNITQHVNISAFENPIVDGTRVIQLLASVSSTDPEFAAAALPDFRVRIVDNDVASVYISKNIFHITEGGATDSFDIRLMTRPTAPVNITFPVLVQYAFNPRYVIFNQTTFADTVTVQVIAINDIVVEGSMQINAQLTTYSSTDPVYAAATPQNATFLITDNDVRVVDISPFAAPDTGSAAGYLTVSLSGAVTLDWTSINYPGFTVINSYTMGNQTVFNNNGVNYYYNYTATINDTLIINNTFIRNMTCVFGTHTGAPATSAVVIGPRTLRCSIPACSPNALDVFQRCMSPVNMVLRVSNQDNTPPARSFYYYWGPESEVINPDDAADETWRARLTGITPTTGDTASETFVLISGVHLAVETTRALVASSIPGVKPYVKIGGFLCSTSYWVNASNHDQGIIAVAPIRKDLEGPTSTQYVSVQVSFDGANYFSANDVKFGYEDVQRKTSSLAWTIFFVAVNVAFFIFFVILLKGWLCSNFCEQCRRRDDTEQTGDIDVRGPTAVSEYLKKRIEDQLSKEKRALADLKSQTETDEELNKRLADAGFIVEENEEEVAEKKKAAEAVAKAAEQAELEHKMKIERAAHKSGGLSSGTGTSSIEMGSLNSKNGTGIRSGGVLGPGKRGMITSIMEDAEGDDDHDTTERKDGSHSSRSSSSNDGLMRRPQHGGMQPLEVESFAMHSNIKKSKKDKKDKKSKKDKKDKKSI